VVVMLLGLIAKSTMNASSYQRSNPARGHELFKLYFLGPDLSLLSIGLFVSTQALRAILNGYGVHTNLGDDFATYFWGFVIGAVVLLFLSVRSWLVYKDDERRLVTKQTTQRLQRRDGSEYEDEVWKILLWQSFRNRAVLRILILGNLFGLASIVGYAYFIVLSFLKGF